MVIVAGMQKSGTTAIAKLLGAATKKSVCSDPFYKLSQMSVDFRKEIYEEQLPLKTLWRRHRSVFLGEIIKDPNFSLLLPQVREMLPDAKIVFIMRDPRDTIRSILNRLNLPGNPEDVDFDLLEIPATWRNALQGQNPVIQGKNYVEILAKRWVMCAQACIDNQGFCFMIRYEDFKNNKSNTIFELAKQLGYSSFYDIEHLVDIQYQPKGNSDVKWEAFFGKEHLAVIDNETMPYLERFGYAANTQS